MPAPGSPPPRKHTKEKVMWIREIMCCVTQTHTLTVVVQVVLQSISWFMSVDACLIHKLHE